MTTIAYNHEDKQIAVDGRLCKGSFIASNSFVKANKTKHGLFILSGEAGGIDKLIKNYGNLDSNYDYSCSGFLIKSGVVYWISSTGVNGVDAVKLEFSESSGSGGDFAISAMDFGMTAKEAVEYAMTRDVYTGGVVTVYDVKDY